MKNSSIVKEHYNTITDFISAIEGRPNNGPFGGRNFLIQSTNKSVDRYSVTKTESYEVASKIALEGYKETLSKIVAEEIKISHLQEGKRPMLTPDFVGFMPHVPNAIIGLPHSMINRQQQPIKQKVITLKYCLGLSSEDSTDKFTKAGTNILGLIKSLELKGYRVALDIVKFVFAKKQISMLTINLKHWQQHINPLKLTYPLTHPSFYRRHCFKHLETHPQITDYSFNEVYGYPIHSVMKTIGEQREWMKSKNLLTDHEYYIDTNTASKLSPSELVKEMKIK